MKKITIAFVLATVGQIAYTQTCDPANNNAECLTLGAGYCCARFAS